ncbi:MAG: hypothetical protein ACKVH8_06390 [Pirellulales bacterium]|jgi:hypothetical protein
MIKYLEAEHIKKFIYEKKVVICSSEISKKSHAFLYEKFPINKSSTIIDWELLAYDKINWMSLTDNETLAWAKNTSIGNCSHCLLVYNANEQCLLGQLDFMICNFDELICNAAGCRLLYGVNLHGKDSVDFTKGIVEFDGKSTLFATME